MNYSLCFIKAVKYNTVILLQAPHGSPSESVDVIPRRGPRGLPIYRTLETPSSPTPDLRVEQVPNKSYHLKFNEIIDNHRLVIKLIKYFMKLSLIIDSLLN